MLEGGATLWLTGRYHGIVRESPVFWSDNLRPFMLCFQLIWTFWSTKHDLIQSFVFIKLLPLLLAKSQQWRQARNQDGGGQNAKNRGIKTEVDQNNGWRHRLLIYRLVQVTSAVTFFPTFSFHTLLRFSPTRLFPPSSSQPSLASSSLLLNPPTQVCHPRSHR